MVAVIIINILVIGLAALASILFMIGSGLFISSGKLLKSNEFGDWSCDHYDYSDIKVRYEKYKDGVYHGELDEFIREYGDTKNWK